MVVETATDEFFPDEKSDPKDWCLSPPSSDTEGDFSVAVSFSGSSATSCLTPRSQLLKAKLAQMREQRLKDLRNRTPQSKLLRQKMAELQFKSPQDAPAERQDPSSSTSTRTSICLSGPSKTPTDAPEEREDVPGDTSGSGRIEPEQGSDETTLAEDTPAVLEESPKEEQVKEKEQPLENVTTEVQEVEPDIHSVAHTILEQICEIAKNIEEISIGEEIEVIRMEAQAQEVEEITEEASHSELLDEETEEVSEEIADEEEEEQTETIEETTETAEEEEEEEEEDRTERATEGVEVEEISETLPEEDVVSETEEAMIIHKLAGRKQRENNRNTTSSRHRDRSQSPLKLRTNTHRSNEYHGERQVISKERKERHGDRNSDRVKHSRDQERRNAEVSRRDRDHKDRAPQRETNLHTTREKRESHSSPQEISPRQHRNQNRSTKRQKSSSRTVQYEHQVELTLDTRRNYNNIHSRTLHAAPYHPDSERSSEEHMFLQIESEEVIHRNTNRYENHHQAIDDAMNSSDIFLPDFPTTQHTDLIHSASHPLASALWTPLQRRHSHQQQQQRSQSLLQTTPSSPVQDPSDVTALAAAAVAAEQAAKAATLAGAALVCLKKSKAHQRDHNLAVAMAAAASASAAAATAAAAVAASLQPNSTNSKKPSANQDAHTNVPFEANLVENLYF